MFDIPERVKFLLTGFWPKDWPEPARSFYRKFERVSSGAVAVQSLNRKIRMPESQQHWAASNKYFSGDEAPKSVFLVNVRHDGLVSRGMLSVRA